MELERTKSIKQPNTVLVIGDEKTWQDFSTETSLHGIKNAFARGISPFRRIGWMLIVSGAIFFFCFQVIRRGIDFGSRDVTVKVEVIYPKQLEFPSVTVCNQNKFRMKNAIELGLYKYFTKIYSFDNNETTSYDEYLPENYDMDFVYNYTGHKQSNFIFRCFWAGKLCKSEYITKTITEYGICFTFNSPSSLDPPNALTVTDPGVNNGLSFLFNTEQYDHMPGPDNDAGVKMFLHNDYKKPLMADLGFAVAAGMHTLIGIKRTESHSLGDPYGDCVNSKYKSHAECMDHCRLRAVAFVCECMPFEATAILEPNKDYLQRICTLSENFNCVRQLLEHVKYEKKSIRCSCLVPCNQIIYEPNLSFSAISEFAADKVLHTNKGKVDKLETDYLEILEMGERYINVRKNRNMITAFTTKMDPIFKTLQRTFQIFSSDGKNNSDGIKFGNALLNDIQNMEKNFQLVETTLFSPKVQQLSISFNYLANVVNHFWNQLYGTIGVSEYSVWQQLKVCQENIQNMGSLPTVCDNFMNEFQFGNYRAFYEDFQEFWIKVIKDAKNSWAKTSVFTDLIRYEKEHINEAERIFNTRINDTRLPFESICKPFYKNLMNATKSMQFNNLNKNDSFVYFGEKIEVFINSLWKFKRNINNPTFHSVCLSSKNDALGDITSTLEDINSLITNFTSNFYEFEISLQKHNEIYQQNLNNIEIFNSYFQRNSTTKKCNLSNSLWLENVLSSLKDLIFLFDKIGLQNRTFEDYVNKIYKKLIQIEENTTHNFLWPFPKKDKNDQNVEFIELNDFYSFLINKKHEYGLHINCSKENLQQILIGSWSTCFYTFANKMAEFGLHFQDINLMRLTDAISKYNDLKLFMSNFKSSCKVNKEFFRKNFAKVDVFYQEMSYQKITQHEKFGFLSFLSEIGGFLGLVLGASVLTVIEFIDFFIYKITRKISKRFQENDDRENHL
ncbi:DgyrCDS14813 [Dimorphilus gyrociliatus]|uniref:DgyrCDS14813 n=1 Tax=Dimorphilus gyrociliatus TaxID=2664684 RepID=A0A7I8WF35_9ANNE|nr:DgyrCDS14813 [Dimorphilus gyrociliatus]